MKCDICNEDSNIIHVTRKYGFVCPECYYKIKESDEEKLREYNEMIEMYKKYGRLDAIKNLMGNKNKT